jgi:hypothetical protein
MYCLHLQGIRVSNTGNKKKAQKSNVRVPFGETKRKREAAFAVLLRIS